MDVKDVLACVGCERAIWIDDLFSEKPGALADQLLGAKEVALECGFTEIHSVLEMAEYDVDAARVELVAALERLGPARVSEIKGEFFSHEKIKGKLSSPDLSSESVDRTKATDLTSTKARRSWGSLLLLETERSAI